MHLFEKTALKLTDHITISDQNENQVLINKSGSYQPTDHLTRFFGHVLIKDKNTGETLVDKDNAINYETMSITMANALASNPAGAIQLMAFGSGGTSVSGTGVVTYFPPNVNGVNANLYDPTYYKVVNNNSPLNTDPADNYMQISHVTGTTYTDIIVVCTLGFNEPAGQLAFDNANVVDNVSTTTGEFIFDELGLVSYNVVPTDGLLLSHVIFNPIQKSLNREIIVKYTVRVLLS